MDLKIKQLHDLLYCHISCIMVTSQVVLGMKKPSANEGDLDEGSAPGSGRSPGEGHGNPHQYCCLENAMDRGA